MRRLSGDSIPINTPLATQSRYGKHQPIRRRVGEGSSKDVCFDANGNTPCANGICH